MNNFEFFKMDSGTPCEVDVIDNLCLVKGDCLEVMKTIPDGSIDMILTDPPYLINYKTNHRKK